MILNKNSISSPISYIELGKPNKHQRIATKRIVNRIRKQQSNVNPHSMSFESNNNALNSSLAHIKNNNVNTLSTTKAYISELNKPKVYQAQSLKKNPKINLFRVSKLHG